MFGSSIAKVFLTVAVVGIVFSVIAPRMLSAQKLCLPPNDCIADFFKTFPRELLHDGASTYGIVLRLLFYPAGNFSGSKIEFKKLLARSSNYFADWTAGILDGENNRSFGISIGGDSDKGNGVPLFVISPSGNVGVRQKNPRVALDVNAGLALSQGSNGVVFRISDNEGCDLYGRVFANFSTSQEGKFLCVGGYEKSEAYNFTGTQDVAFEEIDTVIESQRDFDVSHDSDDTWFKKFDEMVLENTGKSAETEEESAPTTSETTTTTEDTTTTESETSESVEQKSAGELRVGSGGTWKRDEDVGWNIYITAKAVAGEPLSDTENNSAIKQARNNVGVDAARSITSYSVYNQVLDTKRMTKTQANKILCIASNRCR